MVFGELPVAGVRVAADADDFGSGIDEILVGVAKSTGLLGADRRFVGRIKEEQQRLPITKIG